MCVHVCTHCVYNFLYSSIHQPTLRFLYSLNIMNNAAMNMGADISLKQSFCFLQIYTEKWDCWINDRSFFNFLRNLHTISIVIGTIIVLNPCSQTFQQAISTQTCHDYISCSQRQNFSFKHINAQRNKVISTLKDNRNYTEKMVHQTSHYNLEN